MRSGCCRQPGAGPVDSRAVAGRRRRHLTASASATCCGGGRPPHRRFRTTSTRLAPGSPPGTTPLTRSMPTPRNSASRRHRKSARMAASVLSVGGDVDRLRRRDRSLPKPVGRACRRTGVRLPETGGRARPLRRESAPPRDAPPAPWSTPPATIPSAAARTSRPGSSPRRRDRVRCRARDRPIPSRRERPAACASAPAWP